MGDGRCGYVVSMPVKLAFSPNWFPCSKAAEADQLGLSFIPEPEGEGSEAGEQRDGRQGLKERLRHSEGQQGAGKSEVDCEST
jgi:hypothetical protein